jgi:hypothetical protein
MALVIFLTTYLIAGSVYLVVTRFAVNEQAKALKAISVRLKFLVFAPRASSAPDQCWVRWWHLPNDMPAVDVPLRG